MQKRILFFIIFFNQLLIFLNLSPNSICNRQHWWTQAELLYWSIKKNDTYIPFVTLASLSDKLPGAIGQPGTKVELSSCNICTKNNLGFRFSVGTLIDKCKNTELELSYFLLPKKNSKHSLSTSGEPGCINLAVPLYDTTGIWGLNGIPGETITILPGPLFGHPGFYGNFNLCGATKFQGTKLNSIFQSCKWNCTSLAISTGLGWMQFCESIIFTCQTHTNVNAQISSNFFNFINQFKTKNNFYGALFGIKLEHIYRSLNLQSIITCGLGVMQSLRLINGSTQTKTGNVFFLTSNPAGITLQGGAFTQPSNIGIFKQNKFGEMFEINMHCNYNIFDNIEISLGYNFIFLKNIARAADQIDRKINSTRTSLADDSRATVGIGHGPIVFGEPGAAPAAFGDKSPIPICNTQNFWIQGLTFGLSMDF